MLSRPKERIKRFIRHNCPNSFNRDSLNELLTLVDKNSHPNINDLWWAIKDIEALKLNSKNFGYEIAKKLASELSGREVPSNPGVVNLVSKPTTQADVESPWFRYWCRELKIAPLYHRKLWEFAFFSSGFIRE